MKIKILFIVVIILLLCTNIASYSQNVAITDDNGYTADSSAMLDIKSLTKGMLVPRLTTIQRNAISNPATGLLVFDNDELSFFFYNGTEWINLSSGGNIWTKTGSNVYLADSTNKVGVGTSTPTNKFIVKGDAATGVNEAIFAVVNANGDTIFAAYPQGARIYVADDPALKAAGSRSGFAVGGFSLTKGALTNEYLRVTPDSVRIYIEDTTGLKASGNRGGFAIGGFSQAKGINDSLFLFSDRTGFNVTYLSQTERDAITNPRISSIIFNTTDSCLQIFLGYWESIWCTSLHCTYPTITAHPSEQYANPGDTVKFFISAIGTKLIYQWQESTDGGIIWTVLSDGGTNPQYFGTRNDTLLLTNVPVEYEFYKYRCLTINACGDIASNSATLDIISCDTLLLYDVRDGKSYSTVRIGNQCWMAENLNYGTKINGTSAQTNNSTPEKYCYSNNEANCTIYGGLYQWAEIVQYLNGATNTANWIPVPAGNVQGICPTGWHILTDDEYKQMEMFLGMTQSQADAIDYRGTDEGGKLKEIGTTHWTSPNTGATNSSFFTALPGGNTDDFGSFNSVNNSCGWWLATVGGDNSA